MPNLVLCSKEDADNYLIHHRTKGSKNGVRLYQYKDGSLTPLGREHYGIGQKKKSNSTDDKWNDHKVTVGGKAIDIDSKYVYSTGTGMKMSLVGRIKYGKKVSDEYDRTHKDLESREKIENDFKRLSEEEDRQLRYNSEFKRLENDKNLQAKLKSEFAKQYPNNDDYELEELWIMEQMDNMIRNKERNSKGMDRARKYQNADGSLNEKGQKKFSNKFFDDVYDGEYTDYAKKALKNFDSLEKDEKNAVANEILLRARGVKNDDENSTGYRFVADRVSRLGGNLDTGNFKEGSKSKKAYSRFKRAMDELENGYQAYENHKTWNGLSGRELFNALREAEDKAVYDVFGAVLQDIGFPDTYINRTYIANFVSDVYRN